jgi:2-oxoglutarate dehydrogenase E1 component
MTKHYDEKQAHSALYATNYDYVETLYEQYKEDPQSVSTYWQTYFQQLGVSSVAYATHSDAQARFKAYAQHTAPQHAVASGGNEQALIWAYREMGHLAAAINPLFPAPPMPTMLDIKQYGFQSASDAVHDAGHFQGITSAGALVDALQASYCGSVSVETAHMSNMEERAWLYQQVEKPEPYTGKSAEKQGHILADLTRAEGIEHYFARQYVGQKRFSLEGGESLIPALRCGLAYASEQLGVTDAVIGMAHRGRLNVMLNVLAMPAEELFKEFEGRADYGNTSGDVKYHLGYTADLVFGAHSVHTSLLYNPSHLEFIGPVVTGSVRARQDLLPADSKRATVLPIIIHGDAAMAGQGVVAETFNMSKTAAFDVGGSLHIVINNQVGFTAVKADSMSTEYCSSIAKSVNAPIFHVNGDDPEAVVACMEIALAYRARFAKDIVIDIVCYRRLGHNESDEPIITLPLLYKKIHAHPTTRTLYAKRLAALGVCDAQQAADMQQAVKQTMQAGEALVPGSQSIKTQENHQVWKKYLHQAWDQHIDTGVALPLLRDYAKTLVDIPADFSLQRQVQLLVQQRINMGAGTQPLNWGMAELLAYAALLDCGYSVRLVGQDSTRGTFSHRQAAFYDQETGAALNTVQQVKHGERFEVYDSVLSETAPLAFEYGYSTTNPLCLNIWEAQFGDFANGAQVIIDQFISSGCQKWKRLSGLVLLLPHGYEGMGPEHSSGRLERFLQLCAQSNLQVCVPSTPAQMFHLLMRQMLRHYRAPLVVMTPKSLLRHPAAVSSLEDLKKGRFEVVIPDPTQKMSKAQRIILCAGKVYYDLIKAREEAGLSDIAIVRIEQLYPFPQEILSVMLSRLGKNKTFIWCQEEPKNQGGWYIIRSAIEECLPPGASLVYAGRDHSAAPAVGYPSLHKKQQQQLVQQALGLLDHAEEG